MRARSHDFIWDQLIWFKDDPEFPTGEGGKLEFLICEGHVRCLHFGGIPIAIMVLWLSPLLQQGAEKGKPFIYSLLRLNPRCALQNSPVLTGEPKEALIARQGLAAPVLLQFAKFFLIQPGLPSTSLLAKVIDLMPSA